MVLPLEALVSSQDTLISQSVDESLLSNLP